MKSIIFDSTPWRSFHVLFACLIFRIINGLVLRTYFNPDEFWQNQEVAYTWLVGQGENTWEWWEQVQIRSSIHPLVTYTLYRLLTWASLDTRFLMAWGPRLLQSIFAAITDLLLYHLALRWSPRNSTVPKWTLFAQLSCWFGWHCYVRPFSNSMETMLFLILLLHHPFHVHSTPRALLLSGALVLLRPTSLAAYLVPLWTHHFLTTTSQTRLRSFLWLVYLAPLVLGFSFLVDSLFHAIPSLPWLSFLRFNLLQDVGALYGSNPWHWALSDALPTLLSVFLPWFITSTRGYITSTSGDEQYSSIRLPLVLFLWNLFIYSIPSHKEPRFLLPVLPLALYIAATSIAMFDAHASTVESSRMQKTSRKNVFRGVILGSLLLSTVAAIYFSRVHQVGVIDAVDAVSSDISWFESTQTPPSSSSSRSSNTYSILFLMSCHSAPYRSFFHGTTLPVLDHTYTHTQGIHRPLLPFMPTSGAISMRYLDCAPAIDSTGALIGDGRNLHSETRRLQTDPVALTQELLPQRGDHNIQADYVLAFNTLPVSAREILHRNGFDPVTSAFHAHLGDEKRVVIFKRTSKSVSI